MKWCNFDLIWIFPFFFLIWIHFLFKLYIDWPLMSVGFCIVVLVIIIVSIAVAITSRCGVAKLKTILMIFLRLSGATSWILRLTKIHTAPKLWWLSLPQKCCSILLRLIYAAGCGCFRVILEKMRTEDTWVARIRNTITLGWAGRPTCRLIRRTQGLAADGMGFR